MKVSHPLQRPLTTYSAKPNPRFGSYYDVEQWGRTMQAVPADLAIKALQHVAAVEDFERNRIRVKPTETGQILWPVVLFEDLRGHLIAATGFDVPRLLAKAEAWMNNKVQAKAFETMAQRDGFTMRDLQQIYRAQYPLGVLTQVFSQQSSPEQPEAIPLSPDCALMIPLEDFDPGDNPADLN